MELVEKFQKLVWRILFDYQMAEKMSGPNNNWSFLWQIEKSVQSLGKILIQFQDMWEKSNDRPQIRSEHNYPTFLCDSMSFSITVF